MGNPPMMAGHDSHHRSIVESNQNHDRGIADRDFGCFS
jgi:hypothetical protein